MKHLKEIKDWKETINKVVCGDSLELMRMIPDNAIDLCLTDPPYGIGYDKQQNLMANNNRKSNGGRWKKYDDTDWDNFIPTKEYFDEMLRISKNQIIWGGNYFITYLFKGSCWLVWNKVQRGFMSDGEMAWTSYDKGLSIFDMARTDAYINCRDKKQHPTQKPLELMRWCLENYAKDCKTVIDPFAGSFTTARACKDMGYDWICIDQEEKYCKVGEKRLEQEVLF